MSADGTIYSTPRKMTTAGIAPSTVPKASSSSGGKIERSGESFLTPDGCQVDLVRALSARVP